MLLVSNQTSNCLSKCNAFLSATHHPTPPHHPNPSRSTKCEISTPVVEMRPRCFLELIIATQFLPFLLKKPTWISTLVVVDRGIDLNHIFQQSSILLSELSPMNVQESYTSVVVTVLPAPVPDLGPQFSSRVYTFNASRKSVNIGQLQVSNCTRSIISGDIETRSPAIARTVDRYRLINNDYRTSALVRNSATTAMCNGHVIARSNWGQIVIEVQSWNSVNCRTRWLLNVTLRLTDEQINRTIISKTLGSKKKVHAVRSTT